MKRQAAALALLMLTAGSFLPVYAQGMTYGARRAVNMIRRKHRHHHRQQMNNGSNSGSMNNSSGSNFIQGSPPVQQ